MGDTMKVRLDNNGNFLALHKGTSERLFDGPEPQSVPPDRRFMPAWTWDGESVVEDTAKARAVAKTKLGNVLNDAGKPVYNNEVTDADINGASLSQLRNLMEKHGL